MSWSSSEEMRRREQESIPMIHYYEDFVNKNSSNKRYTVKGSEGVSSARRRQHQQQQQQRQTTTKSSASSMMDSIIRVSLEHHPVSPLTPTTEEMDPRNPRRRTTTTKEPTTTPRKLTLYERSQIRLKEREKNLQKIKEEMMRECTFRPSVGKKANHNNTKKTPKSSMKSGATRYKTKAQSKKPIIMSSSTPTASTEATTPSSTTMTSPATTTTTTASSTRQYWQDLQRKQQQQQQQERLQEQEQQQQQQQQHISTTSTLSKEDGSKTVSTTKSLRFEELYQDGLRRARLRPATEKDEQELRRKRQEEKEMKECTFKPKLYWGNKLVPASWKRGTTTTAAASAVVASATPPSGMDGPASGSTCRVANTRTARGARGGGHERSLSPRRKMMFESISPRRRKVFESLSPRRNLFEPPPRHLTGPMSQGFRSRRQQKPQQLQQQQERSNEDPIPDICLSPISVHKEEDNCASLSLLRRHHNIMRERNRRVDSPIPPLPLEIITTGVRPVSPVEKRPWRASYLYARDNSISPLRGRDLGIEIDSEYVERTINNAATKLAPRVIFDGTTIGGESIAVQSQSQVTEYGSI